MSIIVLVFTALVFIIIWTHIQDIRWDISPIHLINNICSRYNNLHEEDQGKEKQSPCDNCVNKEERNNEKVWKKFN